MVLHEMKSVTYDVNFLKESEFCADNPDAGEDLDGDAVEDEQYCRGEVCMDGAKCKYSFMDMTERDDALVYIRERSRAYPIIRQHAFVISSIREPCDHYLSLWAFGSAGHGGLHRKGDVGYGRDPPYFDSSRDIDAFRHEWLRSSKVDGLIAWRHNRSYGDYFFEEKYRDNILDGYAVDCWVYVDDFEATFYACLREYEMQGGDVNWTLPLISDLVKDLQLKKQNARHLESSSDSDNRTQNRYNKNNPINNVQENHHSKCAKYFDNETAAFIRYGKEAFIFDHFGYLSCCGGRFQRDEIIMPTPLAEGSKNKHTTQKSSQWLVATSLNKSSHQLVDFTSLKRMDDGFSDSNFFLYFVSLAFFFPLLFYVRRNDELRNGL